MRCRTLPALVLLGLALWPGSAHATIPAWARKYNMNCSGCHTPNVPRLNARGYAFKWAGYRMPEEIGEDQQVQRISDYMAARAQFQYVVEQTGGQPATANGFNLDNATVFAGGALGKNFGSFMEIAHSEVGNDLMVHLVGVWGKETQYVGFRAGNLHWLYNGGVAGFDRPTGISDPTPMGQTTRASPFAFASAKLGVEAFDVTGKNRFSVEILNSFAPSGATGPDAQPGSKDFAVIDQYIYDYFGSGITAVAFFGAIRGLDSTVAPHGPSHYARYAISANKIFRNAEVQGGYVYGTDASLPVGGAFSASTMTGTGYWGYAGYTFPNTLTTFTRYEVVNPDTRAVQAGNTRLVFGAVLPVNLPEYLRLAGEYTLDMPRLSGAPRSSGFVAELMFAF